MVPAYLFFDLGNVLMHFDHRIAARRLAELSGAEEAFVWEVLFEQGLQDDYESGALATDELHGEVCRQLRADLPVGEFAQAISDIFWPNRSIIPVVAQLEAAGYRMGVLSNTCDAHWQWLMSDRFPFLQRYFDDYVLSYQLGVMKPDSGIYDAARRVAGAAPGELFFVDDRPENVAAARTAGWDAVLYQSTPALIRELLQRGVTCNL